MPQTVDANMVRTAAAIQRSLTALIWNAYLRQDFAPDAHICKITVQAELRVEATTVAVLVLPQHQ